MESFIKKIFELIIYLLVAKLIMNLQLCRNTTRYIVVLAIGTLLGFTIGGNGVRNISYTLLFILFFVAMTQYKNIIRMINQKIILKDEYIELQKKYYDNFCKNNRDMRKFQHDTSHHFQNIQFFLQEGQIEEAKEYLNHMGYQFGEVKNQLYHCGIYIIDVVLNQFKVIIDKNEINFKLNYRFENSNPPIKDADLSSILYNLLQNAVEASNLLEQSQRKIELSITERNSFFSIIISNNVDINFTMENIKLQRTTKKDKKNHGIGLKNVQTIVEQYHGIMQFEKEDSVFKVKILLNEL